MEIDFRTCALILIDLQKGIVGRDFAPYSGTEVLETSRALARSFREAAAPVVLVHVAFEEGLAPPQQVDEPMPGGDLPANWSEFAEGLRQPGDIAVLKRHWGAFTGTDLDLQLRRRGVKTVVIAGIATNFGVESTARSAWEHSYNVVIVEDACTSASAELHAFAFDKIFPRISRVVKADRLILPVSTDVPEMV